MDHSHTDTALQTPALDHLFADWADGDREALNQIMPLVIDDIYAMAAGRFSSERVDHTLQPTALVNELYLRLVNQKDTPKNRLHFFATAALTIKSILIDHARRKSALKAGRKAGWPERDDVFADEDSALICDDMLALNQALNHLERADAELARIVHLRFFLGLTFDEIGALLGHGRKWVRRRWELARAMLLLDLETQGDAA